MKYICLICILFQHSLHAQNNPGSRSKAMGSAGTALQDVWSLQQNSAGAASIERAIFALGYEQHYLDPELSTQSAVFGIPVKNHVLGLSFQRYGISEYLEQTAGLALSRSFSAALSISLALKYHQISIPVYGSGNVISVDAGMQYSLNDRIRLGSYIYNPGRSRINELSGSHIHSGISVGLAYLASDKLLFISDLNKMLDFGMNIKMGIEYQIVKRFYLRGGLSANPFKQTGGFGLKYRRFSLDAAVSSHPILGYSPNLSFNYEF
ncbi:MAG: hypothetical protein B7X86_13165 [Sphingobacteriales bacterium 17-39-43]|uniref:hypothetical protein n=1 Tax=Daejeonella sp. TaxID=2805397 RepID=UPI000BCD4380|nr:hypothetical protein [Daejeonella sp.]OYX93847.1 MAG: hypothetical protein B7Y76_11295 [Sphingobacteriia bacterium 35-40-5]OYZ30519.1 MAG: hypothetical protein B7Y24_12940 [Sphingobacteriales bacterium 16-39-50]OZA23227.1 MAG: hypothetical protein B7X86_13165 [Sphingobacteriales bacterium 17-39-43]OZA61348.1 MAG: hypothetical protein B7X75_02405 [Sphingobacteriales bacterium 39-40-5]HQS51001.1 hypothetical protein [Daejeonella sp.]